MALEKITDGELKPRNLSGFRALLRKLAAMYNAQLNTQIVTNSGRNLRTLSETNDTFELDIKAAVAAAVATLSPFDVVKAPTQASPGRVRVVNGRLQGVLPQEMNIPDGVLPDGTDNQCYLTALAGTSYVFAKLAIDATSGLPDSANVYVSATYAQPDGSFAYLLIATLNYIGGTLSVQQEAEGHQSLLFYCSPDGQTIYPTWTGGQ